MSEQLKVFNLSLDSAGHVTTNELLASDDLEGDLLAGAVMDRQLNLSKGPLAERADDLVGADALLRLLDFLEWHLHVAQPRGRFGRCCVIATGVLLLLLMLLLLLVSTDVGRGERDGQLLVLEASGSHDGEREGSDDLSRGQGTVERVCVPCRSGQKGWFSWFSWLQAME